MNNPLGIVSQIMFVLDFIDFGMLHDHQQNKSKKEYNTRTFIEISQKLRVYRVTGSRNYKLRKNSDEVF